jgi:hypothetical protein
MPGENPREARRFDRPSHNTGSGNGYAISNIIVTSPIHSFRSSGEGQRPVRCTFDDREQRPPKELARERRKRNDPNWTPRASWFSGNPNVFFEIAQRKERLFRRLCWREISAIEQNYAQIARALSDG